MTFGILPSKSPSKPAELPLSSHILSRTANFVRTVLGLNSSDFAKSQKSLLNGEEINSDDLSIFIEELSSKDSSYIKVFLKLFLNSTVSDDFKKLFLAKVQILLEQGGSFLINFNEIKYIIQESFMCNPKIKALLLKSLGFINSDDFLRDIINDKSLSVRTRIEIIKIGHENKLINSDDYDNYTNILNA